jgi:hypothetical protein
MVLSPPELFSCSKVLITDVSWVSTSGQCSFEAPLEVQGLALEGLRLRSTVYTGGPVLAAMLQLEYIAAGRKLGPLDRIDWNPIHTHNNRGKGPPELQFIPQTGSHHHTFDWNWLPDEGRMRTSNLPVAIPLSPDPVTVAELFGFAEGYFRIKGLGKQQLPEWQEDLFRSLE